MFRILAFIGACGAGLFTFQATGEVWWGLSVSVGIIAIGLVVRSAFFDALKEYKEN